MTSIRTYDPASAGAAPPELPPMPIGALAVGTAELLQQAADLPAPTCLTIYDHQAISLHFAGHKDSILALAQWARRFGSITTSRPGKVESDTGTWHMTDFDYYGIAVHAFAFIPAAPASS
jgi:hypothetical protein